ncbi:hypothetical protein [Streptomyces lunaelactis]|uniref:hypothetical protein n=1 Tax=Streptomyces lunaelactis TaxID=1535768 RepID=UPI00158591E8|nr:hypothetical protein [Streptomyces lunaelactis]NUK22069.1 hypothetical protein [Streptomyces lunaelactis]
MKVPGWLLGHTVTVEPYEGSSANGPKYGPPVSVACLHEDQIKLVRNPAGEEVTSSAVFYAQRGPAIPAKSRVTLPSGRKTTVIVVADHHGGGLPTPDHLEVRLL